LFRNSCSPYKKKGNIPKNNVFGNLRQTAAEMNGSMSPLKKLNATLRVTQQRTSEKSKSLARKYDI